PRSVDERWRPWCHSECGADPRHRPAQSPKERRTSRPLEMENLSQSCRLAILSLRQARRDVKQQPGSGSVWPRSLTSFEMTDHLTVISSAAEKSFFDRKYGVLTEPLPAA